MKIALIGSSGGNLYRQGGSEPFKMIQEIVTQCKSAGIECSDVVFVGEDVGRKSLGCPAWIP